MNCRHLLSTMRLLLVLTLSGVTGVAIAQSTPPGLSLIKTEELKADLYKLADAHFKGRSAGTVDELKAAAWLGQQFRNMGLKPMGEDGSYFQYFNLIRKQLTDNSTIQVNNVPLSMWKDVAVSQMVNVDLTAPVLYLGDGAGIDTNKIDVAHKVVALQANAQGINLDISLPTWRYNRSIYTKYGLPLIRRGAAAIIFIADDEAELAWDDATENFKRGIYDVEGVPPTTSAAAPQVPVIWMHARAKDMLMHNANISMRLNISTYLYPSVNVVAAVPGTDPKLKSEYVLFSGHTDAHGIRNVIKGDSIYYGADDNASVDVAMMANARAFMKYPAKRSMIFVVHGAEERGLMGSRYYAAHPTVPIGSIVAVLNGDMIGRNATDSAALLGVRPPHRNSTDLVNMAMAANREGPKFIIDTTWDNPAHVEFWYFRSDHLPYARLGIPALMYTSLLHPDYHTPQDDAKSINYPKLKKMSDWMYRTAWKVANAARRPATDPGFKLER